jgi:hypothetical protein
VLLPLPLLAQRVLSQYHFSTILGILESGSKNGHDHYGITDPELSHFDPYTRFLNFFAIVNLAAKTHSADSVTMPPA